MWCSQSGEEILVAGPDVMTSCGWYGRPVALDISVEYLVGIGGPCSPIGQWSEANSYSANELELLRSLQMANETTQMVTETTQMVTETTQVVNNAFGLSVYPFLLLFSLLLYTII